MTAVLLIGGTLALVQLGRIAGHLACIARCAREGLELQRAHALREHAVWGGLDAEHGAVR